MAMLCLTFVGCNAMERPDPVLTDNQVHELELTVHELQIADSYADRQSLQKVVGDFRVPGAGLSVIGKLTNSRSNTSAFTKSRSPEGSGPGNHLSIRQTTIGRLPLCAQIHRRYIWEILVSATQERSHASMTVFFDTHQMVENTNARNFRITNRWTGCESAHSAGELLAAAFDPMERAKWERGA